MAEPFGVPAGRVSSEVPGAHPGGPRPLPPSSQADADDEAEATAAEAQAAGGGASSDEESDREGSEGSEPTTATTTPLAIGDGEEVLELNDDDRAEIPTRSDDQS